MYIRTVAILHKIVLTRSKVVERTRPPVDALARDGQWCRAA
jgi:hypothetical protein